jgi:polyhydroxybutyrate depolymerase
MGGGVGGAGGLPGPGGVPGTGGAGGKPSEAPDAQATGNGGSTAAPDAGRDATLGADATPAAPPKGPSAGCGKPTPTLPLVRRGGSTKPQLSFMARAEARTAIVRIPAGYSPDKQYPLVILFHGYGNQGEEVDGQLGSYASARSAAVIVSPDGLDRVNSGKPAWWDTRDVPVFDEVTAWAKANLCIDLARVFIAGVSNGASMVNTIACARGDSIRGLGVVAGSLPAMNNCQRSVAMVGVHSPMDTEVPVASGIKSRDYWRKRNLCADKALMPTPCDSIPGCAPGLAVAWCEHGEGVYQEAGAWTYHGWARAANEAVWGFFSKL